MSEELGWIEVMMISRGVEISIGGGVAETANAIDDFCSIFYIHKTKIWKNRLFII